MKYINTPYYNNNIEDLTSKNIIIIISKTIKIIKLPQEKKTKIIIIIVLIMGK